MRENEHLNFKDTNASFSRSSTLLNKFGLLPLSFSKSSGITFDSIPYAFFALKFSLGTSESLYRICKFFKCFYGILTKYYNVFFASVAKFLDYLLNFRREPPERFIHNYDSVKPRGHASGKIQNGAIKLLINTNFQFRFLDLF